MGVIKARLLASSTYKKDKKFHNISHRNELERKIILGPVHANQVDTLETKIFFTRIETFRPHDAVPLIETESFSS